MICSHNCLLLERPGQACRPWAVGAPIRHGQEEGICQNGLHLSIPFLGICPAGPGELILGGQGTHTASCLKTPTADAGWLEAALTSLGPPPRVQGRNFPRWQHLGPEWSIWVSRAAHLGLGAGPGGPVPGDAVGEGEAESQDWCSSPRREARHKPQDRHHGQPSGDSRCLVQRRGDLTAGLLPGCAGMGSGPSRSAVCSLKSSKEQVKRQRPERVPQGGRRGRCWAARKLQLSLPPRRP